MLGSARLLFEIVRITFFYLIAALSYSASVVLMIPFLHPFFGLLVLFPQSGVLIQLYKYWSRSLLTYSPFPHTSTPITPPCRLCVSLLYQFNVVCLHYPSHTPVFYFVPSCCGPLESCLIYSIHFYLLVQTLVITKTKNPCSLFSSFQIHCNVEPFSHDAYISNHYLRSLSLFFRYVRCLAEMYHHLIVNHYRVFFINLCDVKIFVFEMLLRILDRDMNFILCLLRRCKHS